ncbi:MAG: hypothetical protein QM770_02410 [Tepidisphaeraceae bacterium]
MTDRTDDSPATRTLRWLLILLLIIAACWMSVHYLTPDRKARPQPDSRFWWAIGWGSVALVLGVIGTGRALRRGQPLLIGLALFQFVLALLVCWNQAFIHFMPHTPYQREVFRKALERPTTPVYGEPQVMHATGVIVAVGLGVAIACVGAIFVFGTTRSNSGRSDAFHPLPVRRERAGVRALLAIPQTALTLTLSRSTGRGNRFSSVAMQILLALLAGVGCFALAWTESRDRFIGNTTSYHGFAVDLPAFAGPRDLLATYVEKMPNLGWFGRHYPPGNLLLFRLQEGLRDGNRAVRLAYDRYQSVKAAEPKSSPPLPVLPPQTFVTLTVLIAALASLPVFYLLRASADWIDDRHDCRWRSSRPAVA